MQRFSSEQKDNMLKEFKQAGNKLEIKNVKGEKMYFIDEKNGNQNPIIFVTEIATYQRIRIINERNKSND